MPLNQCGELAMPKKIDTYDGDPWTEMDIEDLAAALKHGSTIEDAAQHLCRSGTVEDVRRKAEELGLSYKRRANNAHPTR
jgi:hypothetical protein